MGDKGYCFGRYGNVLGDRISQREFLHNFETDCAILLSAAGSVCWQTLELFQSVLAPNVWSRFDVTVYLVRFSRVRSRVCSCPCGICGGHIRTGRQDFVTVRVFPCQCVSIIGTYSYTDQLSNLKRRSRPRLWIISDVTVITNTAVTIRTTWLNTNGSEFYTNSIFCVIYCNRTYPWPFIAYRSRDAPTV